MALAASTFESASSNVLDWRQKNWISGRWEVPPRQLELDLQFEERVELEEGVSVVLTENGSQLLVSGFGLFVGFTGERVVVRLKKRRIVEMPAHDLQLVVIASKGVSLSSDLVQELALRGVRLSFLTRGGSAAAMLHSPTITATVATRRDQLAAETKPVGAELALAFVAGKIANQERLLRYFGKYLKTSDPERWERVRKQAGALRRLRGKVNARSFRTLEAARGILMGAEGSAGRVYWAGVKALLGDESDFPGRLHRGARDPINSALNYGYGILYTHVWSAALNAGLEPFAGFLHVDRSGKPSLVLDLIEEFRQPIVDRAVLAAVRLGSKLEIQGGFLEADSREWIAAKVLERLTSSEIHGSKRLQLRSIIQMQARAVARRLRGGATYRPFRFRW